MSGAGCGRPKEDVSVMGSAEEPTPNHPPDRPAGRLWGQPGDPPAGRPADTPIDRPIRAPIDGPIHSPIDGPADTQSHVPADAQSILTFRDALGMAMELAYEYAFVNAEAILDQHHRLHDLIVAEGIGRTIEPVVGWLTDAVGLRFTDQRLGSVGVVLVTVRPFDVDVVREQDLFQYRRAGWAIAQRGAHLIDWLETDGDCCRSYAYVTCPARAWESDPPGHRLSDGRTW